MLIQDAYAAGNYAPIVEASQDVQVLSGMENDTHTTVEFTRYLEVTDKFDIQSIKVCMTRLDYVYGPLTDYARNFNGTIIISTCSQTAGKLFFIYAMGVYDLVGGPNPVNYHFLNRGKTKVLIAVCELSNALPNIYR